VLAALLLAPGAHGWGGSSYCSNEVSCADVGISGHAEPQPIRRGNTSSLKISPKNNGPSTAYGIEVHTNVNPGLRIKDVRIYGGQSCSVSGSFVRCFFGDFVREQMGVVVIKVKGPKTGTFISDAKVYSQGVEDPNGGNGQVSMTIHVQKRIKSR